MEWSDKLALASIIITSFFSISGVWFTLSKSRKNARDSLGEFIIKVKHIEGAKKLDLAMAEWFSALLSSSFLKGSNELTVTKSLILFSRKKRDLLNLLFNQWNVFYNRVNLHSRNGKNFNLTLENGNNAYIAMIMKIFMQKSRIRDKTYELILFEIKDILLNIGH